MNLDMSESDAQKFFDMTDTDRDGLISYREFVSKFGEMIAGVKDTGLSLEIQSADVQRTRERHESLAELLRGIKEEGGGGYEADRAAKAPSPINLAPLEPARRRDRPRLLLHTNWEI